MANDLDQRNASGAWPGRSEFIALALALLVAWVATLGSLYFSEVRHFVPCTLCWYQRILMYPLALLFAVGLLRNSPDLAALALPFSLVGQGVGMYHYLLQKTTLFGVPATCQASAPCTASWINWFGFITIPFLSMTAFTLITVLCVAALALRQPTSYAHRSVRRTATITVLSVIGVCLLAYWTLERSTAAAGAAEERPFIISTIGTDAGEMTLVETETTLNPRAADSAGSQEGEALYQAACAVCHGADARGVAELGTDLVASPLIQRGSTEQLLAMIRTGRPADAPDNVTGLAMPPSGGRPDLDDNAMRAVIDHLQRLSKENQ